MKNVTVLLFSLLSLLLMAGNFSAAAPSKGKISPGERPDMTYSSTPERIVYKEDGSFGMVTYRVKAYDFNGSGQQMGWAAAEYNVSVAWGPNGYTGYSVTDKAVGGGYDMAVVKQAAERFNLPTWLVEAGVIAHESQHVKDHKTYDLLNFEGLGVDGVSSNAVKNRRAEISDRMEARAMAAEVKGIENAIQQKIGEIDTKQKSINQSLNRIKKIEREIASHEKAVANGNTKKILSPEKLAQLTDELSSLKARQYEENWAAQIQSLQTEANRLKLMKKDSEAIMLRMCGDARIAASGTRYVDAYNAYVKNAQRKERITNDKKFKSFLESTSSVLDDYFKACADKLRADRDSSGFTQSFILPDGTRPVCRPCAVHDTMGRCGYFWCANGKGKRHTEYMRQKGDYIPLKYSTLEPPFGFKKAQ